ncbi:hypothetical protein [Aquitalea magnusonii]|uniref:SnoaL-like domain-containing protein n=1 Tax=Aquitalea magnusonii TaxID=332411 RepID=A0A318J744_9NEIS|nr:hypothetical protein [Aquitalea magnusonii]PXX42189.1 hypothetical protein DFR38_12142 [Aquitalea magnusonii]
MNGVKTVLIGIYTVRTAMQQIYHGGSINHQARHHMQPTDIYTALDDILNQQQRPLEDVLDHHFSPHYRQRTNGHWDDRQAFVQHARKLREVVASARIEVLDELRDGQHYADRHRVHVTNRNGSRVVQEVYLFAEFDVEGRFVRIEETTLMLEGMESDRDMGSMK